MNRRKPAAVDVTRWTIFILAGGRSSRMGRDKSRLVVGGQPLIDWVRSAATATGSGVRTIRKDLVPKCGPLGGIATGLRRARTDWCLFLSCDMPRITPVLLRRVMARVQRESRSVFVHTRAGCGFPFAIPVDRTAAIEAALAAGELSLQRLAQRLRAARLRIPAARAGMLMNVNTPTDLATMRRQLKARAGRKKSATL